MFRDTFETTEKRKKRKKMWFIQMVTTINTISEWIFLRRNQYKSLATINKKKKKSAMKKWICVKTFLSFYVRYVRQHWYRLTQQNFLEWYVKMFFSNYTKFRSEQRMDESTWNAPMTRYDVCDATSRCEMPAVFRWFMSLWVMGIVSHLCRLPREFF